MRIAFNPSTVAALTTPPNNKDITFDLRGRNIFARGVKFQGTDTNTWRPVVDSLTSDSTTSSLSAKQGKILAGLINNKSDSGHNHDDRYIKKVGGIPTSAYDLIITPTNLSGDGYVDVGGGIHVKAHTGTPFQLWLHDTSNVWYKKTSDGAWKKMDAGYADIAGSVAWANVTGKPSSYTPSAHTHAWNSLTHSSTTANQAILTNGSVNGWKLYTLNISAWDNAANNAHSHSNKAILDGITSALVSSWNTAYNFVDKITKADTDKVINKWDEIVNFLAGIDSNNKLNTLLNSKLSIQQLAANDILTTKTNNALFWVNTVGTAGNIPTGPFTDHPYALLSVTNYSQNDTNGKFFYRSRLAFSSIGDIKVASCHHQNEYKQDETWYNVLTSKNSGISGSTIKLNGTSITVYSSGTADNRYVKKSGDTMTGALNFANGTWNLVGDDSYMGDCNISGHFGIKAANTTYPGIAFFNNASAFLGNLTAYSGNIKYGAYSLQFLDNGNTSVSSSTWTNPFSAYDSNAVADGQAICVWGQSSYLSNLAVDTGDMSLWLKRVNANVATLNMVLDGEYYAKGNQRLAHVSEIPSSLKNPYALTISLNGTSQGPYDGSAAKSINITAASIGAATSGHNHDERYYTKAESNTKYITDITTPVNKLTFTRNGSNIDRTITVNNVQSLGRRSPLTERNAISGIYTYGTYSNENNLAPVNYFETLGFGEGTAGAIEIGGSWISGGQLYWRALRDIQNNWFSWKTILDSSNYSGILDSRYYTEAEVNSLLSNKLNTSNFNWTNLPGKIVAGNEFNIVNAGFKEGIWFNYLPINDRSNPATINSYHFGNGNKGYTYIVASGFIKNGSNSSYVLLGDGGHQTISSLSVNYANSSGSASHLEGGGIPGWGTLTAANGFTNVSSWDYGSRGAYGLCGKSGILCMQLDGYFYQNEGQYRVLDTSDVAGLKGDLTIHQYLSAIDATWWPLIWGGSSHANTSDSTGAVYKSHDKLSWQTSSQTLYATKLRTTNLDTQTAFFHPGNDSTLKIYSGITQDAVSDGHIGLQTSIDNTDGQTHVYPTQYGSRCVLALQPRGGSVYIGNMPNGGNGRKLNVNGDIGLFNTGSIRDLAIGGGIYWNPYVESAGDGSDAASITLVKSGVAGGTTLVLSQMNDANDTIQFQTNGSARLYHNSNQILTSGDTKVSSGDTITINGSSLTVSKSDHNHDGRYVRFYTVTSLDCNNLSQGLTAARTNATNAAHSNHSAFLYISDVGTPFQLQIPDSSVPYIYKRYAVPGGWSGWFKLSAGYADSAGNADKVDGYHATDGRTFNGDINWGSWNDAWSDGTHAHPWYGFDHRYPNTGAYSTTITDYFGMTIKTANTLRLDFSTLLLNGTSIYDINVASATNAYHLRINSANSWSTWNWSGQGGQPTWLWGSNDGTNMYVWNPSNFSVNYANSAGSATKVIVNQHTANDINYPLVWSNQSNTNSATENQLFKSWADLYYNPKNKRLCVAGSAIIGASAVPSYTLDVRGNIIADTWLRTRGEGGWYSESYGGGIWMWDTSWIRTYGNKGFYCDRQIYSSNSIRMNDIYLQNTNQINNGANGKLHLNYQNTGNVTICNGGGAVTIGSTSDDIGNNKLYVNGSEFINGASNVLNHVYADGFRHRSHNSNDSVLLAGGGYSQGVPVRYWAIYSVFIGNSSTDVTYTRRSGNYSFISDKSYEVEGVAIFEINFPSGYNKNNTLIFGNGDHRTSSNWRTPVYVTITTHNGFGSNTNIRVMIADDYSFNAGFANIYFMCMG